MKKKIVIAILCAAVSMGTIGCGNSTASAKTTQTQTDKKEDSKSENSEKSSEEKQSRDIFAMDTYMTVTAYGEHASEAVDKAETEIKRLDGMLSTGNENSEVYKLNQNGEAVVSDDTAYLYERSEKIYKQTKGVFDISIYPVMDAWGFTTENYRIPAEDELSALLKNVDASKIQYDKKTKKITLPKNVKIDFGGIAKGYTSSRIMQIYKKCGVTSGLVSLGGNVQLLGAKPDGSAWKVAVESPDEDGNYLGILQAKDKAVITSGGYERYFEKNGKNYHHTVTNRGQTSTTTLEGKDTLFENETYAYYPLTEAPANYKEVSMDKDGKLVFSEVKGQKAEALTGVTAELLTQSSYGDYQLNLDGLPEDKITSSNVNAVVVKTTDGTAYGMRHLENIWRGNELAWSTGYTESVHGCPTSSAHYASMMGKTIDSIEYYTTNGLYTIDVNDLYVPVKFAKTEDAVKVVDADISAGKTAIELNLRDDFDPEYTVEGLNVKVEGNVLTFKADSSINPGKYTLTVKDKNGKYADLKTIFILSTTDMPATYDADNKKLTVAENSNEEAFNTYIGNITSVNVNGTDYAASGRGSVKIIDKDGTLVTDAAPFKDAVAGTEFQITVTSTGYTTPLAFTYKVPGETPAPSEVDTTKLAAAIEKAEGLNESDYTKDSWKALQSELTKAKSALEAKESQDTVDKAADSLNKAIDALETATPDEPTKEVSTDALEKAMKAAGALKESDYTADSWKALQSALAEADTALKEKKNQDTVDKATEKLNKAISALVKKDAGQKVNGTDGTNGTSGKSGKTGSTSNTKSGKAAKTGDPSGMFAWLGLAVTSLGAGIGGFSLKRKKREDEE